MAVKLTPIELERRDCPAVNIRIDYSYDTQNFFNSTTRRAAIERAADVIDSRLQDTLAAIVPNATHTWTATTFNAITNQTISIPNPTIAANELVIYVAGGALSGALGVGAGGGYSTGLVFAGDPWPNTIKGRGQSGALANPQTDYSPWGGFVSFESSTNWNFNATAPAGNQFDFESVALHELLHVMGIGLGNVTSFSRYVSNHTFTGPNAVSVYGGAVPLNSDDGHWAPSVTSGGQTAIMVPALLQGTERIITPLDWAALADFGWQLTSISPPPPPPPPPPAGTGTVRVVVGSGPGSPPTIAGLNSTGGTVWTAHPFNATFTGGVRVATGDFTGDGVKDIVVGSGPGSVATVQVLNGATRRALFSLEPFGTFTGGIYVTSGDVTGDGIADLIISPDRGGGPRVRIFNGNGFAQVSDFFGIDDVNFRGGARVATGDINGDSRADLIVSAGFGGGPRVAVFNGKTLALNGGPKFFGDFFAFETTLRNGAFIAADDLDGDGKAELIAGGGPGGGPRVSAFSGADLLNGRFTRIADFFAGDPFGRGGVRLAAIDRNGDGKADLATGDGESSGSRVAVYDGRTTLGVSNPAAVWELDYFFNDAGVFVG
ncbi:hypothetical protein BH11PLA2_BH11PLA2_51450 [soil metagenome]